MVTGDEDPRAKAREFGSYFGNRAFADATELLIEDGREHVVEAYPNEMPESPQDPETVLEQYWWGLYGQYGVFEAVNDVALEDGAVTVELDFAGGTETATVVTDGGDVVDFFFSPEYAVPEYVDRATFAERHVTIDAGDVDLGGVFAMPQSDGPFPGVVLVHGQGIHDPDGTVGASKILKDVAWGLATNGIASLRYEKRLHDHEVTDENYTLDTVVTADALAAVSELVDTEEVDTDRVFVSGHSQGATCAPRIADRHGEVAGVVILDGLADPTPDPDDLAFARYAMDPHGDLSEQQRKELETQRKAFRRLANDEFDADETIMGHPGVWHRSWQEYDPLATASSLDVPVLVMKTGRADEELQPELAELFREGFEEWQAADLPNGSRTEYYEDAGHYFQDGPTPVRPSSLYFGGNVTDYVISDLVEWIHDVAEV